MDRNLKIRLIVSKTLINVEFSEENIGMSRNRENSMTIALWEGLARTSLNLEFDNIKSMHVAMTTVKRTLKM